mgnify:CR=1 FL=1
MQAVRVRRVGNSLGLILPREALAALGVEAGDLVYLVETPQGYVLTPYDPGFAAAMDAFEEGARQYRNALRALADAPARKRKTSRS